MSKLTAAKEWLRKGYRDHPTAPDFQASMIIAERILEAAEVMDKQMALSTFTIFLYKQREQLRKYPAIKKQFESIRALVEKYGDGGEQDNKAYPDDDEALAVLRGPGTWGIHAPEKYIKAITKNDFTILHLVEGTVRNETCADKVVQLLNEKSGGPRVTMEWFRKFANSILYHEGTNQPKGIEWPVAKEMLRSIGVVVGE